jgi:hypothetical protein
MRILPNRMSGLTGSLGEATGTISTFADEGGAARAKSWGKMISWCL